MISQEEISFSMYFVGYFERYIKKTNYIKSINFNNVRLRIFDHIIERPLDIWWGFGHQFKNLEIGIRENPNVIKNIIFSNNNVNETDKVWINYKGSSYPVLGCYSYNNVPTLCSYPNMKTFAKLYESDKYGATLKMVNLLHCSIEFVEQIMDIYYTRI